MVLSGAPDAAAIGVAAERVRSLIAMHDWSALRPGLRVTVSAGITLCRAQDTPEQLLARADAALYAAKRAGRNRIEFA